MVINDEYNISCIVNHKDEILLIKKLTHEILGMDNRSVFNSLNFTNPCTISLSLVQMYTIELLLSMERKKYIFAKELYTVLVSQEIKVKECRFSKINEGIKFLIEGNFMFARDCFYYLSNINSKDAFSFYTCHMIEFNNGMVLSMLESLQVIKDITKQNCEFYGYYKGIESFVLNENRYYNDAFISGHEAIELNKKNIYAIHAICHYYFDTKQYLKGKTFIESMKKNWIHNYGMRLHLLWHYALFMVETGDHKLLNEVYSLLRIKNCSHGLEDLDATSLLFRLMIRNKLSKIKTNYFDLAECWSDKQELGFYFFNDFHAALIFGLTNNLEMIDFLMKTIKSSYPHGYEKTKYIIFKSIKSYFLGDFNEVVNLLNQPIDYKFMGGSNAQRSIIVDMLNKAKLNLGVNNEG